MSRIKPVKIAIPWYRRNINPVQPLDLGASGFEPFDLDPDKRHRRKRRGSDPSPDPTPSPQPSPIRVPVQETYPRVVTIEGKQYVDDGVFLTPVVDVKNPDKLPKPTPNPNTNSGGGRIPDLPKPGIPGLGGAKPAINIGIPGDEILLKLMETDPSYAKFVKTYNDITMRFLWEVQNPFIVFEFPSYNQVKKLLKTFDIEKMNAKDVKAYFKEQGVTGKDLNTAATRFFIYYETLKVGGAIEDIIVPPVPKKDIRKS